MLKKANFKNRKGNTMVLVVLSLVVLFGCVAVAVDAGYMYSEKARLQTAADAAAIAGAYKLEDGNTAVINKAKEIAFDNGVPYANTNVNPNTTAKTVKVTVSRNVVLFFARLIGFNNANISATATAQKSPPAGVKGLIPLGIAGNDWNTVWNPTTKRVDESKEFLVKVDSKSNPNSSSHVPSAGNFHAVDFPGSKGGKGYREYLAEGYGGEIVLGQTFDTETGNMAGPTEQGATDRISSSKDKKVLCTCNDPHNCSLTCPVCNELKYSDNDGIKCARIAVVPVLNILSFESVNGKKEVKVAGFAAIFITRIEKDEVYARFVNDIITPEGKSLTGGESKGVTTVKLIN